MRATLSLLGLYNYDNTVLDGLTLPDNFSATDLETLKNNILLETAEFEVLYSDPIFLKFAITQWCNKRKPTWKWLKDTQNYEYNPLWNENYTDNIERDLKGTLDATDVRTDALKKMTTGTERTNHSGDDTLKRSGTDTDAKTGTETAAKTGTETAAKSGNDTKNHSGDDTNKKTGNDTTLNSVYAMNEQSNPAPESGSTVTYNSQIKNEYDSQERTTYNSQDQTTYNTQDQTTFNTQDQTTYNSQEKQEYNSENLLTHNTSVDNTGTQTQRLDHDTTDTGTVDRTVQGLHGAFAQDAIKKEQELALFNILDFITTDFKKRFCLLVY